MIRTFHNVAALARGAADLFARTARSSIEQRGRFTVALSGGGSPRPVYELLAEPENLRRVPWENVFVFWGDERYVPLRDDRSNAGRAQSVLLDHVPIPPANIFPIYDERLSPDEAAAAYEKKIRDHFGHAAPRFDLILLGCGENGHTASLFPETPVLEESERLVAPVRVAHQDIARVTLTVPLLNMARITAFIAFGSRKASVVRDVINGPRQPEKLPAQLIQPVDGVMYWYLDTEAASALVSPPAH